MSDPGVDTQVARALARERSKTGEWLAKFWPVVAALVMAGLTLGGNYVAFSQGAKDAAEAVEILKGDPTDAGRPGLVQQVRENTAAIQRRESMQAANNAEVIRRLDLIQASQTTLERSVVERLTRLETKIEGGR